MPDAAGGVTMAGLHRDTTRFLRAAFAGDDRAETAARDARLIVAHAAGMQADRVILVGEAGVPDETIARVRQLAVRRADGAPVSRLVGCRAFYGRDFRITDATLDPRPDTECVVDAALARIDAGPGRTAPLKVLDLGTGSGILLLTLLAELPGALGIGTDVSPAAVECARANAHIIGVADRSAFVVGDWAGPVAGRFDLVVSNPPYVAHDVVATLLPEVRDHDPVAALDGGTDGLDAYRSILPAMQRLLSGRGFAVVEIGHDQGRSVSALAASAGLSARIHLDLAGRDRAMELASQP